MAAIKAKITRYIDNSQPGWVECSFRDAWGKEMIFEEKVPIVTTEDINIESDYPQLGLIEGIIVRKWKDLEGRNIFTVNTKEPYDIESTDGINQFDILESQIVE